MDDQLALLTGPSPLRSAEPQPQLNLANILAMLRIPPHEASEAQKRLALLHAINQQANMRQGEMPQQGPVSINGGAGFNDGLLSGGGRVSLDVPTLQGLLQLYMGGGGAAGSVNTPNGRQRVREFSPAFGMQFRKEF